MATYNVSVSFAVAPSSNFTNATTGAGTPMQIKLVAVKNSIQIDVKETRGN